MIRHSHIRRDRAIGFRLQSYLDLILLVIFNILDAIGKLHLFRKMNLRMQFGFLKSGMILLFQVHFRSCPASILPENFSIISIKELEFFLVIGLILAFCQLSLNFYSAQL
jgi:hypothetical protein